MHSTDDLSNLELLLEEAKIDPNVKNNDGDTPLHLACESEKFSVVQLLVRDERCNPHEKNSNSDTALHVACRHSKISEIITYVFTLVPANHSSCVTIRGTHATITSHIQNACAIAFDVSQKQIKLILVKKGYTIGKSTPRESGNSYKAPRNRFLQSSISLERA